MSLIGRLEEQRELQRYSESKEAEFVVIYGRRRVGKTHLVRRLFDERFSFYATGVAGGRKNAQFKGFNVTLRRYGGKGTAKALHVPLVTPGGLVHNQYSGVVQSVVTAEDLFAL